MSYSDTKTLFVQVYGWPLFRKPQTFWGAGVIFVLLLFFSVAGCSVALPGTWYAYKNPDEGVVKSTHQNMGVMVKEGDIYLVNLDKSSEIKNLTGTPDVVEDSPRFTKEGRVLFCITDGRIRPWSNYQSPNILGFYVMDVEGKNRVQITSEEFLNKATEK